MWFIDEPRNFVEEKKKLKNLSTRKYIGKYNKYCWNDNNNNNNLCTRFNNVIATMAIYIPLHCVYIFYTIYNAATSIKVREKS